MSKTSIFSIISQQITIYLDSFILITGFFGGVLNLTIFLSLQTFRQNSCAFYLTAMSGFNIAHLSTSLLSHILINGFGIDWTATSLVYCKIRYYTIQLWLLSSFSCMCLATIDQFLATCSNPFWHRWSNIKLARYAVVGFFFIWLIHGIPIAIYYRLIELPFGNNPYFCSATNINFGKYITFGYIFVFMGALPLTIMIIFGLLAYNNVQNLAYRTVPLVRRELDKQLTQMVLVQVIYNAFALAPFVIVILVTFNLPPSELTNFVKVLVVNIHNFYFAVSHKIFYWLPKSFFNVFVQGSFLYIYICIKTISPTISSCLL